MVVRKFKDNSGPFHHRKLFDTSHTVVWQSLVILSAVLIWILWARRLAPRPAQAA